MQFLGDMSPQVNWSAKTVAIGGKKLHTVNLSAKHVHERALPAPTPIFNSFAGLDPLDSVIEDDVSE